MRLTCYVVRETEAAELIQFAVTEESQANLLALDVALQQLEPEEPEAAKVVKLRYFAALTIENTALAQGLSVRAVNRLWAFARAWLYDRLR